MKSEIDCTVCHEKNNEYWILARCSSFHFFLYLQDILDFLFLRIYYGYIDCFVIRNMDLYGFIIRLWVPKNLNKSVKIWINL